MLLDTIEELQLDSRLVRIERSFTVHFGFVLYSDYHIICMRIYDADGLYDGIRIFKASSIESVSWNGNLINSRMKMIERNGVELVMPDIKMKSYDDFISSANEHYGYVALYDEYASSSYIGPVHNFDDEWLRMTHWGSPACLDRVEKLIDKDEYQSIGVDSMYQRNLALLHQSRTTLQEA